MRNERSGQVRDGGWVHGSEGGAGERRQTQGGEFARRESGRERPGGTQDWRAGGWGFGSGPGSTGSAQGASGISAGPGGGHGEQWEGQSHENDRSQWWYQGATFGGGDLDRSVGRSWMGRGPRDYQRDDSRIWEDVCDRLTEDPRIDAREIEVRVQRGEVTLEGTVRTRMEKREAENLCGRVPGVVDVHNRLRVVSAGSRSAHASNTRSDDLGTGPQGTTAGSRAP